MSDLVGLNVETPDMMGKLGQLLTLRNQRAQVQQEEQSAQQRKNIAAYDWNKHLGEDGTLDVESFASDPEAPVIFGDQYVDYLQKSAQAKQNQLTAKQTLMNLRTDQRKQFAEMVGGLRSDPDVAEDNEAGRQKVNSTFIQYQQMYGTRDTLPVLEAYGPALQRAPKGRVSDALKAIQLQAFDVENQVAAQQPQLVSTGGSLKNVNPNVAGGSFADIPLTLAPGTEMIQDANGRWFVRNVQSNSVTPVGTGGGAQPPPSASPSAPTSQPASQPTFTQPVPQQKELETHISDVRKADSDYGTNRHVNDEILRLSADTSTGPGTKGWHNALGKVAGVFGGDATSDYQTISAMLDRQAALASSQMGLPETNAGLQTAANLSGTTEYAPGALQTKVKLTDALVEGAHQYRQGLDKVIGTGPNQDLSRLQQFRAQWADNFDPNVFRVENALRRDDKKELAQIREEVGSRGMAELKRKSENLRKLEAGELLP